MTANDCKLSSRTGNLSTSDRASRRRSRHWRTAWLTAVLIATSSAHAQFAVSDGGNPTYSQAIAVPPGVAGMSPKIGLFYAGGGVNGPVGYGWSLQGMSVITRCPPSKAIDGARAAVTYSANDKLCLDGQRLIQTDTAGAPLAFPQTNDALGLATGFREYRTEKDTYARIRGYGYANGDTTGASGPAYFKVWTKSGQIYDYGASPVADANTKALITPYNSNVAIAWAVARISDTLGNFIDFKYEQRDVPWGTGPTAGTPTPGHEWNLLEIQYAGNKVVFTYSDRASTAPQDSGEAYHQGSKNVSVRRLQSITTYVNSPNITTLGPAPAAVAVKTTNLTYGNGPMTGRSLLGTIHECAGGAASTRCLPATSFNYAPGGNDAYQANANFNRGTLVMLGAGYGVLQGDFNGDGKLDFIRYSDAPAENQLYLSNGDGSFTQNTAFNITDHNLFKTDTCFYTVAVDVNGDGLPDLLRYSGSTNLNGSACSFDGQPDAGQSVIYLNNGNGSFTKVPVVGLALTRAVSSGLTCNIVCQSNGGTGGWTAGANFFLLDINGDGKLDIIKTILPSKSPYTEWVDDPCQTTTCTTVWFGNGDGTFTSQATNLANTSLYIQPSQATGVGLPKNVVDFDGDGNLDLINVGNIYNKNPTFKSSGDGNFTPMTYRSSCDVPLDFNGDGRVDCLVPGSDAPHNVVNVSVGAGSFSAAANFNLIVTGQELTGSVAIDLNGDGRQDILRAKDDAAANAVYRSNGDGTFTQSSTFNLNNSTFQLVQSDNTVTFLIGDFTGRGTTEILRLRSTPTAGAATANQLYVKVDPTPPDQLVSVTSSSGATTSLYYVPLSNATPANAASGSYGSRYTSDRGTANAAGGNKIDLNVPQYVVVTSVTDSGVGSSTVATEYSYAGLKLDLTGRGLLGFREVRRQSLGPNGDSLTVFTKYLQDQPYIGLASRSETRYGTVNNTGAQLLSTTVNIYCDKTAAAGAESSATETAPCQTTAKVQRPYLRQSVESGSDLTGIALPQVTTTNTLNANGDPTTIVVTTTGTTVGISQTFTKITTNSYDPDNTTCSAGATCYWILGRLSQATVQNTVPNSFAQISTSAGSAPNASATAGTGSTQAAVLTPTLAFGNVNYGSSSTRSVTLANDGAATLSITVPTATSVTGTDFSFLSTTCTGSLAAGASCTISVKFIPSDTVARTGTLSVTTGAGALSSNLSGTGLGSKATRTSTATLASPTNWYGAAAQTVTATYRNDGTAAMTLGTPSLSAPLSVTSNTCSSVAPGASCNMVVTIATNVPGIDQSQVFTPSGATLPPAATTVTWTTFLIVARWSSTSLDFGTVTVGNSASQAVTLYNDGNVYQDWAMWNAVANLPTGYSLNTSACTNVAAGGGSCSVTVTFTPPAVATYPGSGITMMYSSYSTNTLSVTGTGATPPSPVISISPVSYDYGLVGDGVVASATFTVTNTGGLGVFSTSVANNSNLLGVFFIGSTTCPASGSTMAGNSSCTITVSYGGALQCGGSSGTRTSTLTATAGSSSASAALTASNQVFSSASAICRNP